MAVFENGRLLVDHTFEDICRRAEITEDDIDILKFLAEESRSEGDGKQV